MICHHFDLDGGPPVSRNRLVGDTNQKESLFSHHVFAVMQLEGEFLLCHMLTYGIPQNARFLEQLAAGSVLKTLSFLQGTPRCGPIALAGERPAFEHESEQQHSIVSINYY